MDFSQLCRKGSEEKNTNTLREALLLLCELLVMLRNRLIGLRERFYTLRDRLHHLVGTFN